METERAPRVVVRDGRAQQSSPASARLPLGLSNLARASAAAPEVARAFSSCSVGPNTSMSGAYRGRVNITRSMTIGVRNKHVRTRLVPCR